MLYNFTRNTDAISSHLKGFSHKFQLCSLLRTCGAYKEKGIDVSRIFFYLCSLVLCNITMNRDQTTRTHENLILKDTCHRFLQSLRIDWNRFLASLAQAIMIQDFLPLRRKDCLGKEKPFFLIVDDSSYSRNRSKKVELLARNWDHAKRQMYLGFRMLTLAWTDGISTLPVAFCNMSTSNKTNRFNEAKTFDPKWKSSFGYRIRVLAQQKMNETLLNLLDVATEVQLRARYVLCDKWFSNPATILAILNKGYEVLCMIKNSRTYYLHEGQKRTLKDIFRRLVVAERIQRKLDYIKTGTVKDRAYLFSTTVFLIDKDKKPVHEVKLVFVRNRNKKSDFLAILSTDTELTEDQIIEYYGCRWSIEILFHTCKSFLRLQKNSQTLDYSEIHASTAIIMVQFALLSWMNRKQADEVSYGELFHRLIEEVQDIALVNAIEIVLSLFVQNLASEYSIPLDKLNETMNRFLRNLPETLRFQYGVAA
jgi:hypothetical protein